MCIYSIHAPARGATSYQIQGGKAQIFQSTLPRGERRCTDCMNTGWIISIHAPARGATCSCAGCIFSTPISIHAPARGATSLRYTSSATIKFQSTLPRGERRFLSGFTGTLYLFQSTLPRGERRLGMDGAGYMHISIHAPARGATNSAHYDPLCNANFNPRSREGSDATVASGVTSGSDFNPRSREGSDTCITIKVRCRIYFNPRSREGSDWNLTFF